MDSGRKYSYRGNNAHNLRTCNGKSLKLFGMVICGGEDEMVTRESSSMFKAGKWAEEEHKRFLLGLEKLGKGNWKGISENFVETRSPTQVASHAQKYFLRKATPSTKKRRYSTLDGAAGTSNGITNQAVESSTQVTPNSSSFLPSTSCPSSAAYSTLMEASDLELTIGPPKSLMKVLN